MVGGGGERGTHTTTTKGPADVSSSLCRPRDYDYAPTWRSNRAPTDRTTSRRVNLLLLLLPARGRGINKSVRFPLWSRKKKKNTRQILRGAEEIRRRDTYVRRVWDERSGTADRRPEKSAEYARATGKAKTDKETTTTTTILLLLLLLWIGEVTDRVYGTNCEQRRLRQTTTERRNDKSKKKHCE